LTTGSEKYTYNNLRMTGWRQVNDTTMAKDLIFEAKAKNINWPASRHFEAKSTASRTPALVNTT